MNSLPRNRWKALPRSSSTVGVLRVCCFSALMGRVIFSTGSLSCAVTKVAVSNKAAVAAMARLRDGENIIVLRQSHLLDPGNPALGCASAALRSQAGNIFSSVHCWQDDLECRADADFAGKADRTVVQLHGAEGLRQADAGAAFFGCVI